MKVSFFVNENKALMRNNESLPSLFALSQVRIQREDGISEP
jgi:hypothetical protein